MSKWLNKFLDTGPRNSTDNTDRFDVGTNMSFLSGPIYDSFIKDSILDAFEERIAITQYDGQENTVQAQRIAYQSAFIDVLNALPYEDTEEGD